MTKEQTQNTNSCVIPLFALEEITLGRIIGQGGFSLVFSIEKIEVNEVYDTSDEQANERSRIASIFKDSAYVLKMLRTDLPEEEYVKGIVDLAIESEFLSKLSHPNLIKMRMMANSDPHESKFFVVLDRLVRTLDKKFKQWRSEVGQNSGVWFGPCFGYCCSREQLLYQTWLERISAASGIANAIYYLHSKRIIYRDLKPDNIGFNSHGEIKLFDFGLAKQITSDIEKTDDGLYHLTGNTGSLRYMAPEVARGEPYDQRVDAYSFGILFWQICSLSTPYAGHSTKLHAERVVRQGHRPKPDKSWPSSWSDLMKRSWSQVLTERPDFDEIVIFLDGELEDMRNNEGEVPSRAREIKAKKTKKTSATERLDVDTRISTDQDGPNIKKHDASFV